MKTMFKIAIIAIVLMIPVYFSSCASIFTRSTYLVTFSSTPPNATISITDRWNREVFRGETPATTMLSANDGFFERAVYTVRLSSPGYEDRIFTINPSVDGWFFANILLGGVIGMVIDGATGAMWRIRPNTFHETLVRARTSEVTLRIWDINDIPESWKAYLEEIN